MGGEIQILKRCVIQGDSLYRGWYFLDFKDEKKIFSYSLFTASNSTSILSFLYYAFSLCRLTFIALKFENSCNVFSVSHFIKNKSSLALFLGFKHHFKFKWLDTTSCEIFSYCPSLTKLSVILKLPLLYFSYLRSYVFI